MTRAVERALGVGAVGVRVTIMGKVLVLIGNLSRDTFIHV